MKNAKKLLSLLCAVTIVFTCFAGITSVRSLADSDTDKIIAAAADYVKKAQNTVTKEELLSAVQKIDGSITLKNEDFYIKHSVDGCYDDDTISGYPLKIEGSDGAVAAIFYKGDTPITFSHAFSHYEQLIHIEKVAVAGQSEGFEYNRRGGSIIGYTGDADKIVIPKGYKGTLSKISDDKFPNRDNVKVIMIKNSDTTYNLTADSLNGFAGNAEDPDPESWKFRSLIALDISAAKISVGRIKRIYLQIRIQRRIYRILNTCICPNHWITEIIYQIGAFHTCLRL